MLTRKEFSAAVAGTIGLVRLDMRAFEYFENTHAGFWRSFWAAAFVAPVEAFNAVRFAMERPPESLWRFAAFQIIGFAFGWLVYPLLMVRIADMLGRRERYFGYFAAYNWFQLIEAAALAVLLLIDASGLAPPVFLGLLGWALIAIFVFYAWFIAKNALNVGAGTALALAVIDQLLSWLIQEASLTLP